MLLRIPFATGSGSSMKPLRHTVVLLSLMSLPVFAALQPGDPAPVFTAKAALDGKVFTFSLKDALAKGPVVVYFYPSAYTQGCNAQAHSFSMNMAKFTAAGASVIGVSLDSVERLERFSADPDYCAGNLSVASDRDGRIAQSYDVKVKEARAGLKDTRGEEIGHGFAQRTTFIVTPDGRIAANIGGVSPRENVEKSLEAVQKLAAP